MVKKNKGMIILNFILALFISAALVDTATTRLFDWSLIFWMAFSNTVAETVIAVIVGVVGLIGLVTLLVQSIMMIIKRK